MNTTPIKQKTSSAPDDIKDILYSFDIIDLEEKISKENRLNEDQANKLRKGIICILVGIDRKDKFVDKLTTFNIPQDIAKRIENEVEEKIFSKVKDSLEKVQSTATFTTPPEDHPNKEKILSDIENPVPTKPIVQNPAGKNPILDAQHNLPEQEKKILIPSAAVPSRGPILNNFKIPPIPKPAQPVPQPIQPQKPPQAPIPPATTKYTTDPYREPLE